MSFRKYNTLLKSLKLLLEQAQNNTVPHPYLGICYNIQSQVKRSSYSVLMKLFQGWSYHSGSKAWPVPSSSKTHLRYESQWRGQQLTYRIDLLKHCIAKMEAMTFWQRFFF